MIDSYRDSADDPRPITPAEKVARFGEDLSRLIDYYAAEYGLTVAECVGVLQIELTALTYDALFPGDDEEDEEDPTDA